MKKQQTASASDERADVYQIVTDRVIELLEAFRDLLARFDAIGAEVQEYAIAVQDGGAK